MNIEIIIPAYNCRKTLSKTLGSLVSQTVSEFSVHIIDDCSTEDLSEIILQFKNLLNIKVSRNIKNLGCGMTRQEGIDKSKADYIAFLDSDDVLMPYTVEVWTHMAKDNPDVDIFHSYFYSQKMYNGIPILELKKDGFTWCHGKLYKLDFIKKWNIRNDARVKYADDSFFNSMCFELGSSATIPIPMYCWLDNQESITRSYRDDFNNLLDDFFTAMKLSTDFLKKCGVKKISHVQNTIMLLENKKNMLTEKSLKTYDELINFLNNVNQEV